MASGRCSDDDASATNILFAVVSHVNHSCNSSPLHRVGPRRHRSGDCVVGLDESWLVTPPACFTAESPDSSMLASHPMEDLLIEHPSMSVYGPRGCGKGSVHSEQSESSSTSGETKVQRRSRGRPVMSRHPPRKPRAVAQCAGILAQVEIQKPAQKAQQRHSARLQSRNKLERSNRVVQYNAKSRNLRRSEHGMKHSGKSNNRRC